MQRRNSNKGFTLVEILIVVIILGILAAIVIPQFTNASTDARKNSLSSQLQTIRSQLELYKLQHNDQLPTLFTTGLITDWSQMTGQSDVNGSTAAATPNKDFGPYLQQTPTNPLNGQSDLFCQDVDAVPGAAQGGGATCGFILNTVTGKVWATSGKMANVYNETDPNAATNDL